MVRCAYEVLAFVFAFVFAVYAASLVQFVCCGSRSAFVVCAACVVLSLCCVSSSCGGCLCVLCGLVVQL